MEVIKISEDLASTIKKVVKKRGYKDSDQFVKEAIEEKLTLLSRLMAKKEVFKIATEVREQMKQKGISEEEMMEDFEKFRKELK